MKPVYFLAVLLSVLCLNATARSLSLPSPEQDTITIKLGEGKRIVIVVDNKEQLRELQEYDINQMIRNLASQLDSTDSAEKVIVVTDKKGERVSVDIVESKNDTTNHVSISIQKGKPKLVVTENEEKVEVKIGDNNADKHKKRTHHSLDFDLGTNNYLNADGKFPDEDNAQFAVRPWGSWNVAINSNYRTHISGPLALQWGGGINWYNFKFQDDATRLLKTEEGVSFYREPDLNIDSEKSKLAVTYLQLQAVPMLDFRYTTGERDEDFPGKHTYNSKAFRIGLGGYAAYRIGSRVKYKYETGGDEKKDKDRDNFYLNNWRYGLRLQMGFRGIDLYANYDLNELFSENRGPQLNAFSFGIIL